MKLLRPAPLLAMLCLATVAACQPPPAADPPPDDPPPAPAPAAPAAQPVSRMVLPVALREGAAPATLTLAGFGPLRIGAPPKGGFRDENILDGNCRMFSDPAHPGIAAMVIDGIVERITLSRGRADAPFAQTSRGIGYGSSEAAVRAAYSPLTEQPHEYLHPDGKNLYTGDGESRPAWRFEIGADGRVSHVHLGRAPALAYTEGCL